MKREEAQDGTSGAAGGQAAGPADADLPATLELLRQWSDRGECLGGQVFVWHAGRLRADVAIGRSGPSRTASPDDVARLYCAVKPVTACCLARAVEAGEASFDDAASRFLPEFTPDGRAEITVRQLLSHTSGLAGARLNPYEHGFDEIVRRACTWSLPASSWYLEPLYNDLLAWNVLAAVVERIYGRGFASVAAEVVSVPAGIPGLRLVGPDTARYVPCHRVSPGFPTVAAPPEEALFGTVNPANGGFASAHDIGLLYAELIRCASGTGNMLGATCTRELIRQHAVVGFGLAGRRAVGLGFMTGVSGDGIGGDWSTNSFGHAGYVGPYRVVHAFGDLDHRVAVAIRFFSVGAKNNWRFHRLGRALWQDLGLATRAGARA